MKVNVKFNPALENLIKVKEIQLKLKDSITLKEFEGLIIKKYPFIESFSDYIYYDVNGKIQSNKKIILKAGDAIIISMNIFGG
jgi:molybdopterin converting factor small subunit